MTIHFGDCLDVMAELDDDSIDAVVTDPPYGLEFMGKEWDRLGRQRALRGRTSGLPVGPGSGRGTNPVAGKPGYDLSLEAQYGVQAWHQLWAAECLRVLKPGGHLVAFGGTRTHHRLWCALEDAGFEIRDTLMWLYGSGFPKSLDVSKAIDKAAGAKRTEVIGTRHRNVKPFNEEAGWNPNPTTGNHAYTAPATDAARQWEGWGTALKPAWEPIVLARKPLVGTVAANVQQHGTGVLNVDGCRIGTTENLNGGAYAERGSDRYDGYNNWRFKRHGGAGEYQQPTGRWPANVVLDEEAAAMLDAQSGESRSIPRTPSLMHHTGRVTPFQRGSETSAHSDSGGASRFFYCAKASRSERGEGNNHPTVKPLALMRWLCRLVTPPSGLILDPFVGSGTTALAAVAEGFRCIGIDNNEEYCEIARERLAKEAQLPLAV